MAKSNPMHFRQLCREVNSDVWGGGDKRRIGIENRKGHQKQKGSRFRWRAEHSCEIPNRD